MINKNLNTKFNNNKNSRFEIFYKKIIDALSFYENDGEEIKIKVLMLIVEKINEFEIDIDDLDFSILINEFEDNF